MQERQSIPERWVAYYTDKLPAGTFKSYDLIVFDRESHPPLETLKAQRKILLGYLSLGEAEKYRSNYAAIKEDNLLLKTSHHEWRGNPVIDGRKPEWSAYVLDVLIPDILAQGFDGIMIDTADSIIHVQAQNPTRYAGLQEALAQLIKQIRTRYPNIKIMLNRGFEILPQVEGDIDMVLAESIYADWKTGNPSALFPAETYQRYVDLLKASQQRAKKLKVYTIDYWPPEDAEGIKNIYAAQRAQGFIPYVSTPDLQSVVPEPQ